jgi:hypothetical protein
MAIKSFFLVLLTCSLLFGGSSMAQDENESLLEAIGINMHGFLDARYGRRAQSDPHEQNTGLSEVRLQLDVSHMGDWLSWQVRSDFLFDEVPGHRKLNLENGSGLIDLREANLLFSPAEFMDVKLGRQILTWGTGDLIFINDLFPKDWQAFFIGRDEEYLKAPSDALFVSLFPAFANIDLVYTPRFDADRFISGERLSYFNTMLDRRAGRDAVIGADRPDDWLDEDELAVRISKNLAGYELALYGYDGFWKSPVGMDPAAGKAIFPKLAVYGASLRGGQGKGLFTVEAGYYDSKENRDGNNPSLPNSEWRLLMGYERELARDFSGGLQYYMEYMEDHENFLASLPAGQKGRDEDRHVLTLRLTKLAFNQNLSLSLFTFYSPSDEDIYARPIIKYKLTDAWLLTVGGNLFAGRKDHTFFGQFEKNSNVYAGVRYSF